MKNRLGQLLLHDGIITIEQLDSALEHHKKNSCRLGESLLDCGSISDELLSKYLKTQEKLYINK
jgi:MSHA biogenesis protein MshE